MRRKINGRGAGEGYSLRLLADEGAEGGEEVRECDRKVVDSYH